MKNLAALLAIALLIGLLAADPARGERTPEQAIRAAINEARLQMSAAQWPAAERILKSLRQQLALDPAADKIRTRVEFVLWDLRMGFNDQARHDLDALGASLDAAPAP